MPNSPLMIPPTPEAVTAGIFVSESTNRRTLDVELLAVTIFPTKIFLIMTRAPSPTPSLPPLSTKSWLLLIKGSCPITAATINFLLNFLAPSCCRSVSFSFSSFSNAAFSAKRRAFSLFNLLSFSRRDFISPKVATKFPKSCLVLYKPI